ncbi:Crp/Fnr family transcriptional regulator [Rhizobiaceae bacterium]|nr:Crp/Fnr family transcriptional regulator [Rhizobiaceae bacterium]
MIAIMSALSALFPKSRLRTLRTGGTLFRRDETVTSIFWLVAGSMALERPLKDGTPLTLHIAGANTLLAEASLFSDSYHCDGVAKEHSTVASLDRTSFRTALQAEPDVLLSLLAQQASEVQRHRTRIEIIRMRRLSDRLDAWLELHGPPAQGGWKAVADTIGVSPAALYRELAKRRR